MITGITIMIGCVALQFNKAEAWNGQIKSFFWVGGYGCAELRVSNYEKSSNENFKLCVCKRQKMSDRTYIIWLNRNWTVLPCSHLGQSVSVFFLGFFFFMSLKFRQNHFCGYLWGLDFVLAEWHHGLFVSGILSTRFRYMMESITVFRLSYKLLWLFWLRFKRGHVLVETCSGYRITNTKSRDLSKFLEERKHRKRRMCSCWLSEWNYLVGGRVEAADGP